MKKSIFGLTALISFVATPALAMVIINKVHAQDARNIVCQLENNKAYQVTTTKTANGMMMNVGFGDSLFEGIVADIETAEGGGNDVIAYRAVGTRTKGKLFRNTKIVSIIVDLRNEKQNSRDVYAASLLTQDARGNYDDEFLTSPTQGNPLYCKLTSR